MESGERPALRVPAGATAKSRRPIPAGQSGLLDSRASIRFGFCGLMLFWWFSVGLQKYQPLLRLRLIPTNRRDFACILGASVFLPTPSLIARSWRGTGVYPREDNALGLVASLQSREQYRLAVYTPPV